MEEGFSALVFVFVRIVVGFYSYIIVKEALYFLDPKE